MIDPSAFAIEEYKIVQEKMKTSRDILNRLEIAIIGGSVVILGVMLGIGADKPRVVPLFAWWAFVAVLMGACIRCSAYYLYVLRIQKYLTQIERSAHDAGNELPGFETFNRASKIGPVIGFAVNMVMWAVIIGIALFLAILKSKGHSIFEGI